MSPLFTTLIMSAVSGLFSAGGVFLPKGSRVCGILTLIWLIAALPLLYFFNCDAEYVLLFYLASALLGFIMLFGGKPA